MYEPVRTVRLVAGLERQVVELNPRGRRPGVRAARENHHAGALGEPIEQTRHEHEVPDVTRQKLELEAVEQRALGQRHDARVAEQRVESLVRRSQRGHAGAHRAGIGELARDGDRAVPERVGDGARLLHGSGGAEDARPTAGEHASALEAEPRAHAGDQDSLAAEVEASGDVFCGGGVAEAAGAPLALEERDE